MILPEDIKHETFKTLVSKVNYGDIVEGQVVIAFAFVQAPKGFCSYWKVTAENCSKVHYLYTAEVSDV